MKLLLDTATALLAIAEPHALADPARMAILDPQNTVLVSEVSAWEIAIKRSLGRVQFDDPLLPHLRAGGFTELPISVAHAELADRLPPVNDDPFDRVLVAQAQMEGAQLVTRDAGLADYDVALLKA